MQKKLFEFGDLFWVPEFYHAFLRRFMGALYKVFGYHRLWLPELNRFINKAGGTVMDPCAGSGYVNELLMKELNKKDLRFYLSDFMIDNVLPATLLRKGAAAALKQYPAPLRR